MAKYDFKQKQHLWRQGAITINYMALETYNIILRLVSHTISAQYSNGSVFLYANIRVLCTLQHMFLSNLGLASHERRNVKFLQLSNCK